MSEPQARRPGGVKICHRPTLWFVTYGRYNITRVHPIQHILTRSLIVPISLVDDGVVRTLGDERNDSALPENELFDPPEPIGLGYPRQEVS